MQHLARVRPMPIVADQQKISPYTGGLSVPGAM